MPQITTMNNMLLDHLIVLPPKELESMYSEKILEVKNSYRNLLKLETVSLNLYQNIREQKKEAKKYMNAVLQRVKKISANEEALKHICTEVDYLKSNLEMDANSLRDDIDKIKEYHSTIQFKFEDPSQWFPENVDGKSTSLNGVDNMDTDTYDHKNSTTSSFSKGNPQSTIIREKIQVEYDSIPHDIYKKEMKSWLNVWKTK